MILICVRGLTEFTKLLITLPRAGLKETTSTVTGETRYIRSLQLLSGYNDVTQECLSLNDQLKFRNNPPVYDIEQSGWCVPIAIRHQHAHLDIIMTIAI